MIGKLFAALLFAIALSVSTALAETVDFASDTVGLPPIDFELWGTGEAGPGRWAVARDDGGQVGLEQYSREPIPERVALATYKPLSASDVEARVRFKALSGKLDRAACIAVRLTTLDDFYTDSTQADIGKVALCTHADSVTRFDQLEITQLRKQEAR